MLTSSRRTVPSHAQARVPAPRRARRVAAWLAAGLFALAGAEPASAVYIRHDRGAAGANGIGLNPNFNPAGYIADRRWGSSFASGTLVAPNKVLTAAHVLDADGDLRVDDWRQFGALSFGTSKNVPSRLQANVKSVVFNPAYKGGQAAYDLAVLTLKSPMKGVAPGRLSSTPAAGRRGAMVGYGFQGTGRGDGLWGANDKLGAFNEISILRDGTYRTDFDSPGGRHNSFGSANPLTWEGTTAVGDSGSALWGDFGRNIWRIVGVLNGGLNHRGADSHYGDISIYASLSNPQNVSFLKAQGLPLTSMSLPPTGSTARYNTRSSLDTTEIPEPGTLLLALPLAGLALLRPRRRRG